LLNLTRIKYEAPITTESATPRNLKDFMSLTTAFSFQDFTTFALQNYIKKLTKGL